MARISEKVKIYVHQESDSDRIAYFTHRSNTEWWVFLGEVEATVDYEESELKNPKEAQLEQAEAALDKARSEFAAQEHKLLERIQSLRALPYIPEGE